MQHTFKCEGYTGWKCGKVVKQNVRKGEKLPTVCASCVNMFRALWGLC